MSGAFDVSGFRARVDDELRRSLGGRRDDLRRRDPGTTFLADELERLVDAGGSRLRPVCTYVGFRAGGGADGPAIVRAAAAIELLHLMALIHDDVMDDAKERRGVPASHQRLAELASEGAVPAAGAELVDADAVGRSLAILVGDLAAVAADLLLAEAAFPPERLTAALGRYHTMRLDMAAGQALDLLGTGDPRTVASLKGGSYSIVGPLLVGAALAGAPASVETALRRVGVPLGTAFQLRDDLRDGDASGGVDAATVAALVGEARAALAGAELDPEVAATLGAIVDGVAEA